MEAVTITSLSNKKNSDANMFNNSQKIIIKKENIGLKDYQHQKYQYNLFNNSDKRDQFYKDLCKTKDCLEKAAPSMQQVVHRDMKRANTNKVYERKLSHELTGPRGLNWQFKQKLQRLENDEREAERDLVRLNRDLARASITSLLDENPLPHQNKDYSRSSTPRSSVPIENNSTTQRPQTTKVLLGRPLSMNTHRTAVDRFTPITRQRSSISKPKSFHEKFPWMSEQTNSKSPENHFYLQIHMNSINQQKREIEEKLKRFLH